MDGSDDDGGNRRDRLESRDAVLCKSRVPFRGSRWGLLVPTGILPGVLVLLANYDSVDK